MLDAAVEVFARRGYHSAGVEEIAEIAGISKPMVYLYFGSKEELFVACIRREADRLMEMITRLVNPDDPPKEQLWSALRGFFGFVADHSGAWMVLYREARTQGGPSAREVAEMRRRTVELIAEMFSQAAGVRKPGEQTLTAVHALVGSCESLADWMLDTPGTSAETTAKRLMHFAWPGLAELMQATRAKKSRR